MVKRWSKLIAAEAGQVAFEYAMVVATVCVVVVGALALAASVWMDDAIAIIDAAIP